ncbi:MAG TPA: LPS export ABC transporter permease LptF [Alphaproteobacteria bacterium]|jgi:lipopolysaccharide export system permease protein|nr:LPS export ABC transporter permease LptF [Alphaproteobacteria bacterium]
MTQITRYILRQIIFSGAIVLGSLVAAIWLTQSLRFIELIVTRGLGIDDYLHLTILLIPRFLAILLPIALFVAVLFTYSRLNTDSELVVLRAIGFAPQRLARPPLIVALVVVAIGYSISLYFLPVSYRAFKEMEFDARNDYSAILLREGVFNTVADGITVYVRARESDGELQGIMVHDNRDPKRAVTVLAERGRLTASDEGPRIVMLEGNRQELDRGTGQVKLLFFERYTADIGKVRQKTGDRWREPRERFLHDLFAADGSDADKAMWPALRAEGHNRLASPLYGLTFVLVALAALLSGEFNRRGHGRRVFAAIVVVILLQSLAIAFGNLAVRMPATTALIYVGPIVPALIAGWWLLNDGPRRRSPSAHATVE